MNKLNNISKSLMFVGGFIEIIAGALHFAMPYFAYQSEGFSYLSQVEINFVNLALFSTGILLITFGAVTIYLASKFETNNEIIYHYLFFKVILWIGRVLLEMLYPAKLKMFYIEPVTMVVMPGLIIELIIFLSAAFFVKTSINS